MRYKSCIILYIIGIYIYPFARTYVVCAVCAVQFSTSSQCAEQPSGAKMTTTTTTGARWPVHARGSTINLARQTCTRLSSGGGAALCRFTFFGHIESSKRNGMHREILLRPFVRAADFTDSRKSKHLNGTAHVCRNVYVYACVLVFRRTMVINNFD